MDLSDRIENTRKEIVTDSYEMSIGELINLYTDGDLIINPAYQRLFRWDEGQKVRLIESILLWFPLPSIFVYQLPNGKWELIDGLQRLSTIFQFANVLKKSKNLSLTATEKLPEFADVTWDTLPSNLRRDFKRARVRVEILKSTSDKLARYELFQRLNTGGSTLTPQEVRNCTISMLNPELLIFIQSLTKNKHFVHTTSITEEAKQKAYDDELVLRFLSYSNYAHEKDRDVHDFLNSFAIELSSREDIDFSTIQDNFNIIFSMIDNAAEDNAFKRKKGEKFIGQFLITKYEVITYGILKNIEKIKKIDNVNSFIKNKILSIDNNSTYTKYSGSGVRAATRLKYLLQLGEKTFNPAK